MLAALNRCWLQGESMEVHNVIEDIVFSSIQTIFASMQKEGNPEGFCFCEQCKIDTACYALNRCTPHYIISSRGVARLGQDAFHKQQQEADIATLVHEGLRRVKHNQRPGINHEDTAEVEEPPARLAYNIPVIMGRVFDGASFAPLSGVRIELYNKGELVVMKDHNWQNPYTLVANTAGSFTFWPAPVPASADNDRKVFEYSIKIEAPGYESHTHFFKVPAMSQVQAGKTFSMDRTFKLPDLYMFPPDEEGQDE